MIPRCDSCKKSLVDGRCTNTKCVFNKLKFDQQQLRHQRLVTNPNYRKFTLERLITMAKASHGPASPQVRELEAELKREVRYHG